TATVSGLTAQARSPFVVTFPGTGLLDSSSLAARVDLPAGSGPYWVRVGDLDGDGRPDLAVANAYSADVYVFRNLNTNGLPLSGSWGAATILPVGGGRDSLYGM